MFGMLDVWNVVCLGCMQDVLDVGCRKCGMFKMWNVQNIWDVGCLRCEMFGLWGVLDMEYFRYGMFGMCGV